MENIVLFSSWCSGEASIVGIHDCTKHWQYSFISVVGSATHFTGERINLPSGKHCASLLGKPGMT